MARASEAESSLFSAKIIEKTPATTGEAIEVPESEAVVVPYVL